ncbi:hypothetical protein [Arthrobacter methylotrophus]|uniref:Uncharacterized protein n=2 Tax=Arthrobacter methylotrophus TaxID=121291 RepID=A0ABV5UQ14_9MICC
MDHRHFATIYQKRAGPPQPNNAAVLRAHVTAVLDAQNGSYDAIEDFLLEQVPRDEVARPRPA